MQVLLYISNFIIPFIVLSIVTYGLLSGINVYETFIKGAKSGFLTVIRLMPTLIGLMAAVGILRASGFLDFLSSAIGQFSSYIGFPGELVPLTIVKMFSSSAATGLLLDVFKEIVYDILHRITLQKFDRTVNLCFYYILPVRLPARSSPHWQGSLPASCSPVRCLWDCERAVFVLK